METNKNASKKEVKKKDSKRTEKRKCKVKYTINKQDEKCNIWLEQNLTPRKTSAIMSMIEQMVETRTWKEVRGLTENSQWRLCKEQ